MVNSRFSPRKHSRHVGNTRVVRSYSNHCRFPSPCLGFLATVTRKTFPTAYETLKEETLRFCFVMIVRFISTSMISSIKLQTQSQDMDPRQPENSEVFHILDDVTAINESPVSTKPLCNLFARLFLTSICSR